MTFELCPMGKLMSDVHFLDIQGALYTGINPSVRSFAAIMSDASLYKLKYFHLEHCPYTVDKECHTTSTSVCAYIYCT